MTSAEMFRRPAVEPTAELERPLTAKEVASLTDVELRRRCQVLLERSTDLAQLRQFREMRQLGDSAKLRIREALTDDELVTVYDEIDDRRERAEEAADYAEVARGTGHRHG